MNRFHAQETAPVDDDTSVARLPNLAYVGTPFVRNSVRSVIWITKYICIYTGGILSKLKDLLRRAEIVDTSLRKQQQHQLRKDAKFRENAKNLSMKFFRDHSPLQNLNNLMPDPVLADVVPPHHSNRGTPQMIRRPLSVLLFCLVLFSSLIPIPYSPFPALPLIPNPYSLIPALAAPNTWSTLAAAPAAVADGGALVYPGSGDTIYASGGSNGRGGLCDQDHRDISGMNGYSLIQYGLGVKNL